MRGDNGLVGWFYFANIYLPGYSAEAVLSPREAGVPTRGRMVTRQGLSSPEAYDEAARAFLTMGDKETGGLVRREAVRKRGGWEILRVEQAPCPVEDDADI
jgi:hypothetical protein